MNTKQIKVTLGGSENEIENSDQRRAEKARSMEANSHRNMFLIEKVRAICMDMWAPSIRRRLAQLEEPLSH